MASPNKLFGAATIKVDGQTYRTLKGATLDPGGVKRNTKAGSTRINGFTEETVPSKLEFEINIGPETSVAAINAIDNATVSFELDSGQTYVVNGMWVTEPAPLEESDGKAKITMEGHPAEELR